MSHLQPHNAEPRKSETEMDQKMCPAYTIIYGDIYKSLRFPG